MRIVYFDLKNLPKPIHSEPASDFKTFDWEIRTSILFSLECIMFTLLVSKFVSLIVLSRLSAFCRFLALHLFRKDKSRIKTSSTTSFVHPPHWASTFPGYCITMATPKSTFNFRNKNEKSVFFPGFGPLAGRGGVKSTRVIYPANKGSE